ncbi:nucleotidyltransferase family protein [Polaribacter ponticola]|uniref:Nucleotidyltransferase family protein n=1 Tax=Polaribacter ponticola TaxID=2978475 RepID=A0ABT5S796_9FLAO|nr:nucleotidyltransferase family protein [Polaribacter sp. MSW5]MDD7913381.1 nucleotidyltransferase family protein [Polaribacter sp. MSW5]
MSYKEELYFIAACLTISFDNKNRLKVEKLLKSNSIDWDNLVKISTGHYVFPALYCNLKREDFLHYLPEDLVSYMKHITTLNRKRNLQIICQAKELNNLLLVNKVTPIFLKGTGNLLAGLYNDVAERMVGDIDFLFSQEDYPKAIKLLRANGYFDVGKYDFDFPEQRHYVRLKKDNYIAAVEIHKGLLIEKYSNEFNYNFVKKSLQIINGVSVLSYSNKLNLSIIASQINDRRYYYKTIALRNAYDVFLLSKKTNAKDAINSLKKLNQPLNFF